MHQAWQFDAKTFKTHPALVFQHRKVPTRCHVESQEPDGFFAFWVSTCGLTQKDKQLRNFKMFVIGSMRSSEFELQADLYSMLRLAGFYVRGEVRGTVQNKQTGRANGNKVRLDIVIFNDKECRNPKLVIEIKPKRTAGWVADYMKQEQYRMYSMLDLPVVMVMGEKQASAFMANIDQMLQKPNGVHWL